MTAQILQFPSPAERALRRWPSFTVTGIAPGLAVAIMDTIRAPSLAAATVAAAAEWPQCTLLTVEETK